VVISVCRVRGIRLELIGKGGLEGASSHLVLGRRDSVVAVLFPKESSLNFTERPVMKMFQHTKFDKERMTNRKTDRQTDRERKNE
jgi:hypothetical protein